MELQKALKDFLEVREIDNQSDLTIRNYRRYVGPFIEWLRQEHNIVDTSGLDVTYLRKWMSHLQKTPNKRGKLYKDSTINLYGVSMIAFCHWLEYERIIPESVTERFKLPRVEQEYIPTFTSEDVVRLFEACEE